MNTLDRVVLVGSLLSIALYGMWRSRGRRDLDRYLKGDGSAPWIAIGISVMATQASAITFLSVPGQGYLDGLGFVQLYFGMPLALILIAAIFLPLLHQRNIFTAYEFLGRRFDNKTRLLAAALFLIQRGIGAGLTIYAPSIVITTVFGWPLDLTIIVSGLLVTFYTVMGGSQAVIVTQNYQFAIIFAGMIVALFLLIWKLPHGLTLIDTMALAGRFHKLKAVDFSTNLHDRYTIWSGLFGGTFLMLSYFGTDQSQVQRYISGASLRDSRLALMFNALCKIPMQFCILMLGVLIFVFYQFERPPLFFNAASSQYLVEHGAGPALHAYETDFSNANAEVREKLEHWLAVRHRANGTDDDAVLAEAWTGHQRSEQIRKEADDALAKIDPRSTTNDADYIFITFILRELPHGVIGLLIAAFFAAALSSKAAELNSLGSTTTIDFYRHLSKKERSDTHYVCASKAFTVIWGLGAIAIALWAHLVENLIQAVNILGSIFYGVMLGLFVVAFFIRQVGGSAIFWAALTAQALVFVFYFSLTISYLWYPLIGCSLCVLFSIALEVFLSGDGHHFLPT